MPHPLRLSTEFSHGFGGMLEEDYYVVALGPGPRDGGAVCTSSRPPKGRES